MTKVRDDSSESAPVLAGPRRVGRICKCGNWIGVVSHVIKYPLRRGRTYPGNQVHQSKAGHPVAWVLDKPQQRQHVLDMGGVEELKTTEFDKGDVAPGQLDFQRTAMT